MKFLRRLMAVILVLILLYFLLGLIKPTISYGHEIVVDKPVKEAWAVAMDETKYGQWLEGFKSIELLSGEKGEPGSTYRVVVNPGEGQEDFKMIETVVSKEEYDHVSLDFDSAFMTFEQTMKFSETAGKTHIKTASKVKGKGLMNRSMFALMEILGGVFTAQEKKNLEALKSVIDKNTTDYYPAPIVSDTTAVYSPG